MLSGFAYNKFYQLLSSRCFKLGIKLISVNPAFSSLIGTKEARFIIAARGLFAISISSQIRDNDMVFLSQDWNLFAPAEPGLWKPVQKKYRRAIM